MIRVPAAALALALLTLPAGPARSEPSTPPAAAPQMGAGAGAGGADADVAGLLAQAREAAAAKRWSDARKSAEAAVKADGGNAEANAWLGLAHKNLNKCRAAVKPLDKAFAGKAGVPGVARALAECLGDKAKDRNKLARAWMATAREDKDGTAALKAAKLFLESTKATAKDAAKETGRAAAQAYAAFELADGLGKLLDEDLASYAAAAEADRKPAEARKLYERALVKKPGDRTLTLALARALLATGDAAGADARAGALLQVNPDDADALIVRADAAAARGDVVTEEDTLRKALAKQEKNANLQRRFAAVVAKQARAKMDAGDAKGAQDKAEEALKLDAKSGRAMDALGRALWAQGDKAKAEKWLKALPDQPDAELSGEGLRLGAELALEAKDTARAKKLLDRAARLGSKNVALTRARLARNEGDLAGAEKNIAAHLAANPGDGEAMRLGGDVAYEAGKARVARERYEAADKLGALPAKGQGRLCEARVRDGAFDGAKAACEKALGGGNDEAAVHANLGLAMYRLGDKEGARKEIAQASSKGARDKSTLLVQGLLAESDGRDAEALAFYDKVLAGDPANVEANAQSGRLLLKRGKHAEAAKRLAKAHKADAGNAALAVSLAKAQLGAGKLGDAQKTIKTIPTGALDEATQRTLNGQVESARGNYKKANEEYEKALAAKPGDPEVLALQGQNFLKLPHYDKAIALLESAQKADPSRTDVTEQLARLYAETGQADKAAQAVTKLDAIQKTEAEQQRKTIEPKDQKRIVIDEAFKSVKDGDDDSAALAMGLRKLTAADLSRSPYVVIVDRSKEGEEAVRRERDAQAGAAHRENIKEGTEAEAGKELAAQYVLTGSFQVGGDGTISLFLKLLDIKTKATKGGTATGSKDKLTDVERKAVMELLDSMGLLSEQERVALERSVGGPNYESFVKMTQADAAKSRGDLRTALKLYGEAKDADQGNPRALMGYAEALKDVGDKNRIAIPQPTTGGSPPESLVLGLRQVLSTKLASVQGIHVIEREKVDAVLKERDYQGATENRENLDPASLPKDEAKELAARVLLQTRIDYTPGNVTLGASLIDMDDNKLILGDLVTGKETDIQQLQNQLALNIVRKLRGEPTDDEMKSLQKIQANDEYRKQMDELARLRAAEKQQLASEAEKKGVPVAAIVEERAKKQAAKPAAPKPDTKKAEAVVVAQRSSPSESESRPSFELGLRSALTATSSNGDHHLGGGMLFTWISHSSKRIRTAWLIDLESTRFAPGRADADRNQTAFYGLGFDLSFPVAFKGTGLFFGAEATYGVLQTSCSTGPACSPAQAAAVNTDWVLQVMPHAGLGLSLGGVGLFADLGWRLQLLDNASSGQASLGGLVMQGGLRIDMDEGRDREVSGLDVGYTARAYVPNGSNVYGRYGGLPLTSGAGPMLGHEITLLSNGHNSRGTDQGVAFVYMAADRQGGGPSMKLYELSYMATIHAFNTHQFVNPYLGLRLGLDLISQNDKATFGSTGNLYGLLGAGLAGIDFSLSQSLVLRGGVAYDGVLYDDNGSVGSSLSGYAVEAGFIFRI